MLGWLIIFGLVVLAISVFYLRGENLRRFDQPAGQSFASGAGLNNEHKLVANLLQENSGSLQNASRKERLLRMREYMDNMWSDREFVSTFTGLNIDGLAAEWVQAPNADSSRRVLYIHGGAFMMGSPKSHRVITSKFSEIANAAVLAIDYRLMPEHPRMAGVEDCRNAYRWILDNGPDGPAPVAQLFVAGDSAGGNLTLSLIAWARDQGLRAADAVVALSPATDSTMSSPSLKANIATDVMLGPAFGMLGKIPKTLLNWGSLIQTRINPSNPVVSPIFYELSNLPPVLIHASEAEMLIDDARRYVNKAAAAGSPVKLQTWAHVPHVWHMFEPNLTEAREAFEEISKFLAEPGLAQQG